MKTHKRKRSTFSIFSALILMVALIAIGCESEVSSPDINDTVTTPDMVMTAKGGPIAKATGSGHFDIADELRNFAFTAKAYDGGAKGQWQLTNRFLDVTTHGVVKCLSVVGNTAWVGGMITSSSNGIFEGLETGFRVVDNGNGGSGTPDQISLVFIGIDAEAFCNNMPAVGLNTVENGNVNVH
ncbi:hypothetical protein [Fodinibius saliphilus]|uniref:hypothetical protein n=1 Tax=Fodinibius saliphilus TaxID=1920650 RepID=UPI00110992ED|nr:hypothetical protein [Fodinibius saliphilus]